MRGARVKEQRRAEAADEPGRERRRRWPWFAGLAVLAVGLPAAVILAGGGGDGGAEERGVDLGLEPFGDPPEAPAATAVAPPAVAPAPAYRVVYRVEDTAGAAPMTSTDVLWVRLPHESRLEHRDGSTPAGEVLSATVTNQRFRFNFAGGEERFVTPQVPAPLYSTISVETLEAAVAAGVAERLGEGSVGDEVCIRYRYRAAGDEVLALGDAQERVESCVTPDSILVSELIVLNGKQVREVEATEVDRSPDFTAGTFLTDRKPDEEEDSRLLEASQRVTEGPAPEDVERLGMSAPEGFERARTVSVGRQLGPASPLTALFVQSFRRGNELVYVEELLTVSEAAPWPEDEGQPVDLGEGRSGRIVYRPNSTEVRVRAGDEFARVTSARPELALAVARTLTDNPTKPS